METKDLSVKLYAEHQPDTETPRDAFDGATNHDTTGFIVVGFEVDGVRRPIAKLKAPGFFADVARAKAEKKSGSGKGSE